MLWTKWTLTRNRISISWHRLSYAWLVSKKSQGILPSWAPEKESLPSKICSSKNWSTSSLCTMQNTKWKFLVRSKNYSTAASNFRKKLESTMKNWSKSPKKLSIWLKLHSAYLSQSQFFSLIFSQLSTGNYPDFDTIYEPPELLWNKKHPSSNGQPRSWIRYFFFCRRTGQMLLAASSKKGGGNTCRAV